jgi:hypothetical protein
MPAACSATSPSGSTATRLFAARERALQDLLLGVEIRELVAECVILPPQLFSRGERAEEPKWHEDDPEEDEEQPPHCRVLVEQSRRQLPLAGVVFVVVVVGLGRRRSASPRS